AGWQHDAGGATFFFKRSGPGLVSFHSDLISPQGRERTRVPDGSSWTSRPSAPTTASRPPSGLKSQAGLESSSGNPVTGRPSARSHTRKGYFQVRRLREGSS